MRNPLICLCLDLGLNDLDLSADLEAIAAATGGLLVEFRVFLRLLKVCMILTVFEGSEELETSRVEPIPRPKELSQ